MYILCLSFHKRSQNKLTSPHGQPMVHSPWSQCPVVQGTSARCNVKNARPPKGQRESHEDLRYDLHPEAHTGQKVQDQKLHVTWSSKFASC